MSSGIQGRLPTFLVIGAAKAGTTALNRMLAQHPAIFMCPVKEPRFFSFEGMKVDPTHPVHRTTVTDWQAYCGLFSGVRTESAIGEVSPSYLANPRAPERIQAYLPHVKLIAILRDPVERAYSHFLHLNKAGIEVTADFEEAIENLDGLDIKGWRPRYDYLHFGFYHEQLVRYFERFDKEQIRVYTHERLRSESRVVLADMFRHVGVDTAFVPNIGEQVNVSGIPRSRSLQRFLTKESVVRTLARRMLPTAIRRPVRVGLRDRNLVRPVLSETMRDRLRNIYDKDIEQLEQLLGETLSDWRVRNPGVSQNIPHKSC